MLCKFSNWVNLSPEDLICNVLGDLRKYSSDQFGIKELGHHGTYEDVVYMNTNNNVLNDDAKPKCLTISLENFKELRKNTLWHLWNSSQLLTAKMEY